MVRGGRSTATVMLLWMSACSSEDTSKAVAEAAEAGQQAADEAMELGKQTLARLPTTAELSDTARAWLEAAARTGESAVAQAVLTGRQVVPAATRLGMLLSGAVDSDSTIEPIYQRVDAADTSRIDAAIADMPTTEIIDGLTVGFRSMEESSTLQSAKERGYLVMWRDGDHLVGFIYRSKRTVDLERVVREAPALVRLGRQAQPAVERE